MQRASWPDELGALALWRFDPSGIEAVPARSSERIPLTEGWSSYLAASRRLVVGHGFDLHELASRVGTKSDIDEALKRLREEAARA